MSSSCPMSVWKSGCFYIIIVLKNYIRDWLHLVFEYALFALLFSHLLSHLYNMTQLSAVIKCSPIQRGIAYSTLVIEAEAEYKSEFVFTTDTHISYLTGEFLTRLAMNIAVNKIDI